MEFSYSESQGSKANLNGRYFEEICGLNFKKLHLKYYAYLLGYKQDDGFIIYEKGKVVSISYPKKLFKKYLNFKGIFHQEKDMPNIEPDNCILNFKNNTIYIIEVKFQYKPGSVDENPQAYIFRQRYFNDLLKSTGMEVKLIYVFSDWFKQNKYNYLRKNMDIDGVKYYYNELPPSAVGLDESPFDVVVHNNVQEDELTLW